MTKQTFKVGDKVRVTCGDEFVPKGTVLTVKGGPIGSRYGGNYTFKELSGIILGEDLELVADKPTKNQRIKTLEQQVAEQAEALASLQAEVEALKKAQQPDVTTIADALAKRVEARVLTPNQKRKAIIDEAKEFVAEVTANMNDDDFDAKEGNGTYRSRNTKPEFIVNNGKRTVVVLVKGAYNPVLYEKGIAKCAPDDVFNADIGKAIALGRALGLDVSKFEQAVKPTEVVDYMKIIYDDIVYTVTPGEYCEDIYGTDECQATSPCAIRGTIIDDTEAQY